MTWDGALPDFFVCLRVTSWPELLGSVYGAMGQCWRPSRKCAKNQKKGGRQDPDQDSPMSGYRNAHAFLRAAAKNR